MKKNLNGRKWKIVLCTLLCTVALFTGCGEEKDENTGKPEPTKGESQEKTRTIRSRAGRKTRESQKEKPSRPRGRI